MNKHVVLKALEFEPCPEHDKLPITKIEGRVIDLIFCCAKFERSIQIKIDKILLQEHNNHIRY
jgi:hypothetical protein